MLRGPLIWALKGAKNETSQNVSVSFETGFLEKGLSCSPEKRPLSHAGWHPRMTCWYPIRGFRGPGGSVVTSRSRAPGSIPVVVPCGQCQGCRLDRARDWSVRIAHEASLYEDNCFVTLTYDDAHLPPGGNLSKRDFQLFMKRLRKSIHPARVRYFAAGEYGDENLRPHYHVILFGYRPKDAYLWRMSKNTQIFRSPSLEKIWSDLKGNLVGHVEFGGVSSQSGGYVARYCLKKSNNNYQGRYDRVDPETGEVWTVDPEFMVCSTVPMIGHGWLKQFEVDCFPSDFVVIDGRKVPVPKAYVRKMTKTINTSFWSKKGSFEEDARHARKLKIKYKLMKDAVHQANNTPSRLETRGEVQRRRIERLTRKCEPE